MDGIKKISECGLELSGSLYEAVNAEFAARGRQAYQEEQEE